MMDDYAAEFAEWLAACRANGGYPPDPPVNPFGCGCSGCTAFLEEYGDLSDLYWRQEVWRTACLLGIRGWSGGFTDGERSYMQAHGSPGFQQRRQRALALRKSTAQTKSVRPTRMDVSKAISA